MIASNPHLGEIASSYEDLVKAIRLFDPERALSRTAGLFTLPEWQSSTVRLEVLQHLIATYASGHKKPKAADYKIWLSKLGESEVGRLEDPAEDVFVSRVLIPGANCLIFEGVYESSAYQLQLFINLLERMPASAYYERLRRAAYSLLRLSDEVGRRSGMQAFAVGRDSPITHVTEKLLGNLVKQGERVRFSQEQFSALGIGPSDLTSFIFDPAKRTLLTNEVVGHSSLERYPLVVFGQFTYLVLPAAVSIAIRRMVIEACDGEARDVLYAAFKNEVRSSLRELPLLGGSPHTPFEFQRFNGIWIGNLARHVDKGRLLHICVAIDDLTTYTQTGMSSPDPSRNKLSEAIQASVLFTHKEYSTTENFREGLSLIVLSGWGRPLFFELDRDNDRRWRVESLSAADLETLSWESGFSPIALWRLLDARDRLSSMNVELLNVNGLLNLHGWARSLNGHLVPHGEVPADYSPEVGLLVMVAQNALLEVRQRIFSAWNMHQAQTWDNRAVRVRREAINSYFEEDRWAPMYVSMDDVLSGDLVAVYETSERSWWTKAEATGNLKKHFLNRLWHINVVWLRRAVPILERHLPSLPNGALLWTTNFADDAGVSADAPVPSLDESRRMLRVSVERNRIDVYASAGFLLASRSPVNIFEALLVEFLVRGALALSGVTTNESKIAELLSEIVPNEWARDMHAVQARDFRDYVRSQLPKSTVLIHDIDDADSRIGLGWRRRNRADGSKILGIDACCAFLGSVVDSLWDDIRTELAEYKRLPLLRNLIGNHEAIMIETDSWLRSARAMLALHEDKENTALVSTREIARFNAGSLSSRILMEMALCECPEDCGREAGRLDLSRLLARVLQIHQYGGWSEAIRYEGKTAEIHITPLGDVFTQIEFDEQIASPYGEALGIQRFRQGSKTYERNYEPPQFKESAKASFEPEFWQAWEEQFGYSIDEARRFLDNIENEAIRLADYCFVANFDQLADLDTAGKLDPQKLRSILDSLALVPRTSWAMTPEGYSARDWYPWRFRRRLSCIARPIFKLSAESNDGYLIAPGMVRTGFAKLMDYCYRGGFEAKDFPSGRLRKWIGAAENRRGHKFNREVRDHLRDLGWRAESDVKLTRILNQKTDRDYGDVDVLAWRDGRILVIECKDLELAMTIGEIARQLYEFRGENNAGGVPDRLKRHLLRIDALKKQLVAVRRYTGSAEHAELTALMVFSDIVPMHFSQVAKTRGVQLMTLDDIGCL